ncbi:STAS domain-containing protein [Actinomadura chibensis]|uniref:Anti-sigma factor antagonist n=1 Tax=Actinomadura chibensis TaxID=392828 RepID=A0A5D0P020_9ACTN|nr:STAS domain-containing protein [Actinomadura chibensis]
MIIGHQMATRVLDAVSAVNRLRGQARGSARPCPGDPDPPPWRRFVTSPDQPDHASGPLMLAITVRRDGSTTELHLHGELDIATAEELRWHISEVITAHDPDRILLDLSELSFADSTGLSVMVWAHQLMSGRGRQLRLWRPQSRVLRILNISGLHRRLHIIPGCPAVRPSRRRPGRRA